VIINSACINEYLDEAFPEPRLSPVDPEDRARMRYWTWTADDSHPHGARLTRNTLLKGSVEAMRAEARMPVPGRRERWRKQAQGGHSAEEMATALDHMLYVAAQMERELGQHGPWLAGATFSLADISMTSLIHRMFELVPEKLPRQACPRLHDWYRRVMARPAAQFVYTAGTAETPKRGPARTVAGIEDFRAG
jgi:glutathione S-transferase